MSRTNEILIHDSLQYIVGSLPILSYYVTVVLIGRIYSPEELRAY